MTPPTSDRHGRATAEELAREFLHAIQAKDLQGILRLLTDDFVLEVPYNLSGTNDLSDSWHGKDTAAANFVKTWQKIAAVKYAEIDISAGKNPDIAFAETLGDMTMANGRPYRNRYVFRFDTAGGKIRRIREYANPATSLAAFTV